MATRFYLPSANTTPAYTPTPRGWNNTANAATAQKLVRTKSGSTQAYTQISCNTTSGGQYHLMRQLVSDPLQAQTISGTLTASIKCYESSNSANSVLSIGVYLIDSSGAYKSTLITPNQCTDSPASPREFTTTAGSRRLYDTSEKLGVAYGSTSIAQGDRLVVEIGFGETATSASYYARIYFGDNETNDLNYAEADTGVDNGWVEFTSDILFDWDKSITQTASGSESIGIVKKISVPEIGILKNILEQNIADGCEDGTWENEWTEFDTDGIMTVSVDEANEYSGSRCLKISVSGDTSNYNYVETEDQAVSPSTTYTVSCQAKTGGSGTGLLGLLWSDADHTFIDNNHTTFNNTTYQKVSFTQAMPANAAFVHVYFTVDIGTGARSFYGDEFQLEVGSSATDWQSPAAVGGGTDALTVVPRTTIALVDWKANPKNKLPVNVANGSESGSVTGLTPESDTTLSSQTDFVYQGNRAIMQYTQGSNSRFYLHDDNLVPAAEGDNWVISAYVNNPDYYYYLGLVYYNSSKVAIDTQETSKVASGFSRISATKTAPANTAYVGFYGRASNYATAYIDTIQLEKGTTATGWEIPFTAGLNSSEVVTKTSGETAKNVTDSGSDSESLTQKNTFTVTQTGSGSDSPAIKNSFITSEVVQREKNKLDLNVANGCEDGTTMGWEAYDGATLTSTTDYKNSGNRSLKVEFTSLGGAESTTYIPVTEGEDYVVSSYIKYDDTNPMTLGISWYDSSHVYVNVSYIYDINGNTSFNREYATGEAPTGAAYARVWVESDNGIAYVDNVQFEEGTTSSTWEAPKGIFEGTNIAETLFLELYDDLTDFVTEGVSAKGKISSQDSGTDTETLTQKNKFTVPQSGTGTETLTTDVNATILDSKSVSDTILIKNMFKVLDSKTASETISIASDIIIQDNFSGAETLIRDKLIPLIQTTTGSDTPILRKISAMLETGNSSELFSIINEMAQTDTGTGTETLLNKVKPTVTQTAGGAEVIAAKIATLIQQTGHGTDVSALKTFDKVSDTATDSEVVKQTKKFTNTDTGSGTETPSMKVSQQVAQSGSGMDTPTLKVAPAIQQTGSGDETTTLTSHLSTSDLGIAVDDAGKLIRAALSDAGTDVESIDIADLIYRVSVGDSDAFDDMVAILSHIGVSDAKTALTEVLTQKNTMTVFEAMEDNEALALANRFAATETGSGVETASLKNKFTLLESEEFTDIPILTSHLAAPDTGNGVEVPTLSTKVPITQSGSGNEVPALKVSPTVTQSSNGSDTAQFINRFAVAEAYVGSDYPVPKNKFTIQEYQKNILLPNIATGSDTLGVHTGFGMAGSTLSSVTEEAWQGNRSVKVVTANSVTGEGVVVGSQFPVRSSTQYTTSLYAKGTGTVVLNVYNRDITGTTFGAAYQSAPITLTSNWQRISVTWTTDAKTYYTYFRVQTNSKQAATFYVDGFQHEEGSSATTWEHPSIGQSSERPLLKNKLPVYDSKTLTDNVTISARLAAIDSAILTEVTSLKNMFSIETDSGIGAETPVVNTNPRVYESGDTSELLGLDKALVEIENVIGSELALIGKELLVSDVGHDSEVPILKNKFLLPDYHPGAIDTPTLKTSQKVSDVNVNIVEVPSLKNRLLIPQLGYGADNQIITSRLQLLDELQELEAILLRNTLRISDPVTLIDTLSRLKVAIPLTESGSGADTALMLGRVNVGDESEETLETIRKISDTITETGLVDDNVFLKQSLLKTDSATLTDALRLVFYMDLGGVELDLLFEMDIAIDEAITEDMMVETAYEAEATIRPSETEDIRVDEERNEDIVL